MGRTKQTIIRRQENGEVQGQSKAFTYEKPKFFGRTPTETVTESAFHFLNWLVKEFKEPLKTTPQYWTVSEYYPQAKGGPVYIDKYGNEAEKDICLKKASIMKQHKMRYAYMKLDDDMSAHDIAKQLEA